MVVDGLNATEVVGDLVDQALPLVVDKFGVLISIFKAVGIVLLIYITYLIIRGILRWKDRRRLSRIEKKVDEIDRKLDKVLGKRETKEVEKKKKEKKKSKK